MQNPESVLENETHKLLWYFDIQTDRQISNRPYNNPQIKRTCLIVNGDVSADNRVKLKENEKKDKFLDLAWDLKKQWKMKVTVISIVVGALGKVTEGLV